MKFIQFNISIRSYEPDKIFVNFKKWGNTPRKSGNLNDNCTIRFDVLERRTVEVSSSHLQKCEFLFFDIKTSGKRFFFLCFPWNDRIESMVPEYWERTHLNGN